jgi:hypothetical protein
MRKYTALVALTAALVLVSCSSSTGSGEKNAHGEDAEKVAAVPSTSRAPMASIAQFAFIIAEHKGEWDDQVDTTKDHCLDPNTVIACSLGYMTLGLKAQTIYLVLTGAHKAGNPTYIGEPPTEVKDLLAETETAASSVDPAVKAFQQAGCADPMDTACLTESIAMDSAVDELSRKLDAWNAY